MTPTPEKSHAWHKVRVTPSRTALLPVRSDVVSGARGTSAGSSCSLWLLATAITMTPTKERSMEPNSIGATFSPLMRCPRMADQRGLVWKKMIISVMGMS